MNTPLQRTVEDLADLVNSIRSDCASAARELLATHAPDAEAISDLTKLDELLAKVSESTTNVCSALQARHQLRQLRADIPQSQPQG